MTAVRLRGALTSEAYDSGNMHRWNGKTLHCFTRNRQKCALRSSAWKLKLVEDADLVSLLNKYQECDQNFEEHVHPLWAESSSII